MCGMNINMWWECSEGWKEVGIGIEEYGRMYGWNWRLGVMIFCYLGLSWFID